MISERYVVHAAGAASAGDGAGAAAGSGTGLDEAVRLSTRSQIRFDEDMAAQPGIVGAIIEGKIRIPGLRQ